MASESQCCLVTLIMSAFFPSCTEICTYFLGTFSLKFSFIFAFSQGVLLLEHFTNMPICLYIHKFPTTPLLWANRHAAKMNSLRDFAVVDERYPLLFLMAPEFYRRVSILKRQDWMVIAKKKTHFAKHKRSAGSRTLLTSSFRLCQKLSHYFKWASHSLKRLLDSPLCKQQERRFHAWNILFAEHSLSTKYLSTAAATITNTSASALLWSRSNFSCKNREI